MGYRFDFNVITPAALHVLADGMLISLKITAVAIAFGIVWGTLLAMMRLSRLKPLQWFALSYITLLRSVPLVMVLLWFFLIVPQLLQSVFHLSGAADLRMISALIAFSLFEAAYYAEIIRAGINSVARGQFNAASAFGLNFVQAMRLIILPQAFRNMIPLLLTQAIVLFQDTSLVYVSALADFFGRAYIIGERDGRLIELLLLAGAVYFVICFGISLLVKQCRKRGVA